MIVDWGLERFTKRGPLLERGGAVLRLLLMGAIWRRRILQFTIMVSIMTCVAPAQNAAEDILPDAPVPAATKAPLTLTANAPLRLARPPVMIGMTTKQKYGLAYRRIVSPQMPLKAAFVSGWEVGTGTGPEFQTNGWVPFAKRFGYNAGGISTTIFLNTAVIPSLVHQDPRFFPLGRGPVKRRVLWAIGNEFAGFSDDGCRMPNYANLVGFAVSSVVMNSFAPGDSASFGDMAKSYAIKIGISSGLDVAREFKVFDRVQAIAHHSKSAEE